MKGLTENKKAQYRHILAVYKANKQQDIPDTRIIKNIFPKHGIFISYVQWMRIKGIKPSELN